MNKKGFTLIELLATIAILGLMSLIIGVNITSILRSTEKNNEDFDKEQIEKAACVFADSEIKTNESLGFGNYYKWCGEGIWCDIIVGDLIKSGLLGDNYDKYKDNTVHVSYPDGEKKCELNS